MNSNPIRLANDGLITKPQAAGILRISIRTLDRLKSEGVIHAIQVSKRRVCYRLDEILKHAGLKPGDTITQR